MLYRYDTSLFTRGDRNELARTFTDPFLDIAKGLNPPILHTCVQGTWGPLAAHVFVAIDGRKWLQSCWSLHNAAG